MFDMKNLTRLKKLDENAPEATKAFWAFDKAVFAAVQQQVAFLAAQYPDATIVKLPYADHFVWRSNASDVMREMNAFMDGLH